MVMAEVQVYNEITDIYIVKSCSKLLKSRIFQIMLYYSQIMLESKSNITTNQFRTAKQSAFLFRAKIQSRRRQGV